jgi:hypothetical protein
VGRVWAARDRVLPRQIAVCRVYGRLFWCGFGWRAPEGGLITATAWPASIPRAAV